MNVAMIAIFRRKSEKFGNCEPRRSMHSKFDIWLLFCRISRPFPLSSVSPRKRSITVIRIVLKDVPNPRSPHDPPLYRRGQTIADGALPPDLPEDHCSERAFPADCTFYLIDWFDTISFSSFTTLRVGDRPERKSRCRSDLDVYGPQLGSESCDRLVITRRSEHGLFVEA